MKRLLSFSLSFAAIAVSALASGPSIASLTPNTGAGLSATFQAVYADPAGATDLNEILLQVNTSQSSANACYVYYHPQTNQLYLSNNAGTVWMTPALTPGVAGTASNGQCTLNAATSSVTLSGNDLTLNAALTFSGAEVGSRNVYLYAGGLSGMNSGWVKEGSWVVSAGPPTVVSPTSENNYEECQCTFVFSDPNGAGDLNEILLLWNTTDQNEANACYVYYNPQANLLYLSNDAGNAWMTPGLTPGVAGSVSNSQCVMQGLQSSVSTTGDQLTLTVFMSAHGSSWVGYDHNYVYAAGRSGQNSGWVNVGTFSPAGRPAVPQVGVNPTDGTGSSVTFEAEYQDNYGASDLWVVLLQVNSGQSSIGACYVWYDPQQNLLYLYNNGGVGVGAWMTPGLTPGVAGTVSNSQCTLNAGSSSVVSNFVSLDVFVALTFSDTFTGGKLVYLYAQGYDAGSSGWQFKGSWTP